MRRPLSGIVLPSLLLVASGCNAPGARDQSTPELGYFCARGMDFLDILEFNVGAGTGLHASAGVEPIRVGLGGYKSTKAGMMGRSIGTWDESRNELFIGLHDLVCWEKRPCYGNGYLFTHDETHRRNVLPDADETERPTFYEDWGWATRYEDWEKPWLDVSAEVHLLFVGVDAGFSIQETLDFLLGIFGVDSVSHDDHEPVPEDYAGEEIATESTPVIQLDGID